MVDVCRKITNSRRDDRREDPGRLVHFGYTCGSRHDRKIQMAAPCVRQNTAAKRKNEAQLNINAQGMAGGELQYLYNPPLSQRPERASPVCLWLF
ncbi:hypothetical protein HD806DRAFT_477286 [Xylariaceae sp. AK1471]|nr:hypothetical protein HD806DRAFT_477286 [Xylariaceae sp. AK1471]